MRQQESGHRSASDDEREGGCKEEDSNESRGSDRDIVRAAQRTACDPEKRFYDDHQHFGLDAKERDLDERYLAIERKSNAESEHDESAGQNEEQAGDKPTGRAVQPPADIGGKLHGLRSRQHHAKIESVQKALLSDPAPFVDEDTMHERDLSGRTPERQDPDLGPDGERFLESRFG